MSKRHRLVYSLLAIILLASSCAGPASPEEPAQVELAWMQPSGMTPTFTSADDIREFSFPADHGAHPEFQTEWWYFTGNLQDGAGNRYGYELTFFRRALDPDPKERESNWAASQVYMAHFAITDGNGRRFLADQRLSRDSISLAGATGAPLASIWLEDWSVRQVDAVSWNLNAANDRMGLNLQMIDRKGPVLQGENGLSRKSAGNASFYYSLTRLETSGEISLDGQRYSVSGESWMDHEFSTSTLASDQVGWDWFALQLDDGSEMMLFTLRKMDGSLDLYSTASLISRNGDTQVISSADFSLEVTDRWTSPHNSAVYPAGWTISVPSEEIELTVTPLIPDQELNLGFIYWEGAVEVRGSAYGKAVSGHGYVELTGYAQSMQGQF